MQFEERSFDNFRGDMLNKMADPYPEVKMYPSIQQSLDNIIVKEGYLTHNIFTRMISTEGGNYLGELYEVDVKGETKEGRKETNIFVKHIIPGQSVKDLVSIEKSYINEIFIYTELGKVFNALQETANISEEDKFNLVKSYDESSTDAILLDNLKKKGFKTLYRMEAIPLKFAELSIKQIAKFHALSFVLKHQRREYFEEKIKMIKSPLQFGEPWKKFARRMIDYSIKYFDGEIQNRMDKFKDVLCEKQPKYLGGITHSIRCLCHGDFRINNVLTKDDDEDSAEVALIDYQLIYYGSPVTDLIHFLYTSTDREFRKVHLEDIKNLYHSTLTHFLEYFNLDINDVYPRKIFDKDFRESIDYGLMVGFFVLPFCFTIEDEVPDFSKDTMENMTFVLDDRFRGRITEIVEEYLLMGIL